MSKLVLNTREWDRATRGRSFGFYATDEEMELVLRSSLPETYGPYFLVGYDPVKEGDRYVQDPFSYKLDEFLDLRAKGIHHFYIRSKIITPELPLTRGDDVGGILGLSGLVILQHGFMHRPRGESQEKWEESSLGLVDKIVNGKTNELVLHEEYLQVFNALKKAMKKILYYPTISTYADGRQEKSTRILMSKGLAEKCRRGEVIPWAVPDFSQSE